MSEKQEHSCIDTLLIKNILFKVEPGDSDRNPLVYEFSNITKKMGNPQNLYFLVLTEQEIKDMIDEEAD